MSESQRTEEISSDHYIALLGMQTVSGPETTSRAAIRPQYFAPGTTRVRTGILATYIDMLNGHCPSGPVGPTIDMRIQVLAPPPSEGEIMMRARALRVGRTFIVAEGWLHAASLGEAPFVRATTTFMNNSVGEGASRKWAFPPMADASMDDVIGARVRDERTLEVDCHDRIANGSQGTIQGGAQTLFAELAAHHALDPANELAVTDVDVRFLSRLKTGPLVATVDEVPSRHGTREARVALTDAGDGDRLVTHVVMTMKRV